jgi:insulysin
MPGNWREAAAADFNLRAGSNKVNEGKEFWQDKLCKYLVYCAVFAVVIALGTMYYLRSHGVQKHLRAERAFKIAKKPRNDMREYQYAELPNGLAVLNIQDEKSTNSGFSVAVEAGSMYDPKDLQGLAHFCEHMLFLGTKKYPEPEGFREFATKHGGNHNAYTADELTVYYMQLDHSGWQEGLDRFADFFRAPLFDAQFVGKEVHAVDSEMAKNKHSQNWRVRQLMFSLADPQSALTNFNVGDVNTLLKEPKAKGIDIVGALKEYYQHNYCAPRMKVVTFGKDSLDVQLAAAKQAFGQMSSGDGLCSREPRNLGSPDPWPAARMGRWVETPSMLKKSELWVVFPLPDLRKEYAKHPLTYLRYLINYGGEKSLKRTLKDSAGLITDLDFSSEMHSTGTSAWFTVDLTPKGRDHPDLVLDHLFAFIAEVRRAGIDKDLFESLADEAELEWNWSNQGGAAKTAKALSEKMSRLRKEDILSGDFLTPSPDPARTYEMLLKLIPSNMNVIFVDGAPDAEGKMTSTPDHEVLPHYDAVYTNRLLENVYPEARERWQQWLIETDGSVVKSGLDQQLKLSDLAALEGAMVLAKPLQNIPKSITLDHAVCPAGDSLAEGLYGHFPEQIASGLWYRQGSKFTTPKVTLKFLLRTPKPVGAGASAEQALELTMWTKLLQEELHPKTVDVVGADYQIEHTTHSVSFELSGFTHNMAQLMDIMLSEFKTGLTMSSSSSVFHRRYVRIRQDLKENLADYTENAVQYAIKDRDRLVLRGEHSRDELLKAVETLDPISISQSMSKGIVAQKLQYTYLAVGNIASEEAQHFSERFQKGLPEFNMGLPESEVEMIQPAVHPQRRVEVRKKNPKQGDSNHVTVVTILLGVPDVADRVVFGVLSDILQSTAFEELRTKRQLGYIVGGGFTRVSNTIGASCVVQGNAMMPDEVEPLIEWLFSVRIPEKLAKMTDTDFAQYRTSFLQSLKEPPKNFDDEMKYFWPMIANGGQCLGLRDRLVSYVESNLNSKQQLIDAWQRVLSPDAASHRGTRSKLVVKYFADKIPPSPSDDEFGEALKQKGVPDAYKDLVMKEHSQSLIFGDADAKARQEILADAEKITGPDKSYYPQEFRCGDPPQSDKDTALLLLQEKSVPHAVDISPH